MTSAMPGTAEAGTEMPTSAPPTTKEKAATKNAVHDHRQRSADEERDPFRRGREHGSEGVLVALAGDRVRHREDTRDRRVLERVADHVELVRLGLRRPADVDEQQDLEDRARPVGRDQDPGREPAEQRPEAGSGRRRRRRAPKFMSATGSRPCPGGVQEPVDDDDADRRVEESEPDAHEQRPGSAYRPVPTRGSPASPRSAPAPTRSAAPRRGRASSGTRKPQISQTGYSSRLPSAQAVR